MNIMSSHLSHSLNKQNLFNHLDFLVVMGPEDTDIISLGLILENIEI
jgi:hypothetical protein